MGKPQLHGQAAFKFIVEEDRKDKSKECGDADYGNGPHKGVFQHHGKNRAACYLAEIFQSGEAFDQTSFTDLAERHAKYKSNRDNDKDRHQKYTGKNPDVWFYALKFFLHRNTSFLM